MHFDWSNGNIEHVARHGVTAAEAEQVIQNKPFELEEQTVAGEKRMVSLGITNDGRMLVVVTTMRGGMVRVVTSFPANRQLRAYYVREKEGGDGGEGGREQDDPRV